LFRNEEAGHEGNSKEFNHDGHVIVGVAGIGFQLFRI